MTPPRLMSLLYYAQAASMAVRGVPMYDEPVMAWKFGPVVEKVYDKYKKYSCGSIPYDKAPEPDAIAPDDRSLLEEMYINFGIYSAWGLRTLIRTETAWKDTPAGEEVPREMMREYFKELSVMKNKKIRVERRPRKSTRIKRYPSLRQAIRRHFRLSI